MQKQKVIQGTYSLLTLQPYTLETITMYTYAETHRYMYKNIYHYQANCLPKGGGGDDIRHKYIQHK